MCGVAGVIAKDSVNPCVLEKMVKTISHRGPDSAGVWAEENVGLAHSRLSIHDLTSAGSQPMCSKSGRWMIVYNGEIYNFKDIRKEITNSSGINIDGNSDTEVLVNAIDMWGIDKALKKTVGMFSLACWDRKEKCLFLARDRFGEKPLYYGTVSGDFVFSSELKAISSHYKKHLDIDEDVLQMYISYGYIPTPHSIYKNIHKLEPGSILKINQCGKKEKSFYWSSLDVAKNAYQSQIEVDFKQSVDILEAKLITTLSGQMLSDVPIGAFLSGGVDSSLIVALMQSISNEKIKTFTIGFENKKYNEAVHASEIAKYLGTTHTELYVSSKQTLDIIPKIADIYDEPFADSSQIPTYLVSELAKTEVTVALSGDAGDELFGGYNRYFLSESIKKHILDKKFLTKVIKSAPNCLVSLAGKVPYRKISELSQKIKKIKKFLCSYDPTLSKFYDQMCSQWSESSSLVNNKGRQSKLSQNKYENHLSLLDPVSWMMIVDSCNYLLDDILVKVDRAAMAVSLETRTPFLDHRIFEFAWSLPTNYKFSNGEGKLILKTLLSKYIPKQLIERPKMGFCIPCDEWLRCDLKDWAASMLSSDRLRKQGYFYAVEVEQLWKDHQSGVKNNQAVLWNLLMFQQWYEKWVRS